MHFDSPFFYSSEMVPLNGWYSPSPYSSKDSSISVLSMPETMSLGILLAFMPMFVMPGTLTHLSREPRGQEHSR